MARDMLLLVWNEFEEGLKWFMVPDTEEHRRVLDLCNDYYVNSTEKRSDEAREALEFLSTAIITQEMVDKHKQYAWAEDDYVVGEWGQYFRGKYVCGPIGEDERIIKVYTAGFIP